MVFFDLAGIMGRIEPKLQGLNKRYVALYKLGTLAVSEPHRSMSTQSWPSTKSWPMTRPVTSFES